MATAVIGVLYIVGVIVLFGLLTRSVFKRRGRWGQGPGAAGAIHDLLIQDKRKAIEIILEERAEYTDPETKDGDLPAFGHPMRSRPPAKKD